MLSCLLLADGAIRADTDLMQDTNICVDSVLDSLHTTDRHLAELRGQCLLSSHELLLGIVIDY